VLCGDPAFESDSDEYGLLKGESRITEGGGGTVVGEAEE